MSVPAAAAERLFHIAQDVRGWTVHDERIDAASTAYAVADGNGWALIDPLRLSPPAALRLGRPIAIVLTAPSHQRAAWEWRQATGASVWAPAGAAHLDEEPDRVYGPGASRPSGKSEAQLLPAGLEPHLTPGPRGPHFVLRHEPSGVLLAGDLILNLPGRGLELLPADHAAEPTALAGSARSLLSLPWEVLCPAHGAPVRTGARQRVLALAGGPA